MNGIAWVAWNLFLLLCTPKTWMLITGFISKEDWYNTESLPWLQILYLRVIAGKSKGTLYGADPWWGRRRYLRGLVFVDKPNELKGYSDILAEMKDLKRHYYEEGLRRGALKQKVKQEMESRYRGDGRILKIIQIVLMILFFFL